MWTQFWDMHSGGSSKTPWERIYIEAPEEQACELFETFFHQSPNEVACDCCGPNYAIDTGKSLSQITAYHRNCDWQGDEYVERPRAGQRLLTTLEYVHKPSASRTGAAARC